MVSLVPQQWPVPKQHRMALLRSAPSVDGAAGSLGIPRTLNSAARAGLCAARQVRQPFVCPPWLHIKGEGLHLLGFSVSLYPSMQLIVRSCYG